MSEPAHVFEYNKLPEYQHLELPEQWYHWIADVETYIAEQYGIGGTVAVNNATTRLATTNPFARPDEWSKEEELIVRAARTVWERSARLSTRTDPDYTNTPWDYEWLTSAQDELAWAIAPSTKPTRATDYHTQWSTKYPDKSQTLRTKSAHNAGTLF